MNTLNQKMSEIGVVPVLKLNPPALCKGGVPVAEVTFRAAGAPAAIKTMKTTCPDMIVGAGTVTTTAQIDEAIAAGAQFIVTPGFDAELVAYCQEKSIAIYPGPTTIRRSSSASRCSSSSRRSSPAVWRRSSP